MFVILGLPLVAAARAVPWFHATSPAEPRRRAPPFLQDRNAALIVPFMVLMLSSLVASTFALTPEVWYPLRALAVAAAILTFLPVLRSCAGPLPVGLLPVAAGLLVGVAWVLTQPPATGDDSALVGALAELPAAWLAAWAGFRVIGSVVLVPVVEEAFFRGYLLARLDGPGWRRAAALVVSSALFALLHERWLAGLLAGLVFGGVLLRRGRLVDAIACHAAANLVLAATAIAGGDWTAF